MSHKKVTITQKGWGGLKYVEVHGVPAEKDLEFGDLVHADTLKKMEYQIAEELLLQKRPICGREIIFLRKIFGMSRREFAREVGLSDVSILKWEKALSKRLFSMSEIAMRVYFAKKLKLPLDKVMTPFIPEGKSSAKLRLDFKSIDQVKAA